MRIVLLITCSGKENVDFILHEEYAPCSMFLFFFFYFFFFGIPLEDRHCVPLDVSHTVKMCLTKNSKENEVRKKERATTTITEKKNGGD